jgi:hypothetical protein
MKRHERMKDLRAQRESIARHLAWLDAEIAQAEHEPEAQGPRLPPQSPPVKDAEKGDSSPDDVETPFSFEPDEQAHYQAKRNRLGCILIAVVVTAVMLFLIWGLPEILY